MAAYSRETTRYPDGTIKTKQTVSDSEIHGEISEVLNLIPTDSVLDEMENKIVFEKKEYEYTLDDLDSNKIEEIFSKIDLYQAKIVKDQEEIKSLAKETDDLLNQLEYKSI